MIEARRDRTVRAGQRLHPGGFVLALAIDPDRVGVRYLQKNSTPNAATPGASIRPVAAVQPISAGIAPGMAPTNVEKCERCFIGMWSPT